MLGCGDCGRSIRGDARGDGGRSPGGGIVVAGGIGGISGRGTGNPFSISSSRAAVRLSMLSSGIACANCIAIGIPAPPGCSVEQLLHLLSYGCHCVQSAHARW